VKNGRFLPGHPVYLFCAETVAVVLYYIHLTTKTSRLQSISACLHVLFRWNEILSL